MESLKELLEKRRTLVEQMRGLNDKAEAEKRELSSEETAIYTRLETDVDALTSQVDAHNATAARVDRLKALEAGMSEPLARQTAATVPGSAPKGGDGAAMTLKIRGVDYQLAPNSAPYALAQKPYRDGFLRYLGTGESLSLQVSNDTKGGYLVPTTFMAELIAALDDEVFIRRISRVIPVGIGGVVTPSRDTRLANADWTPEVPASDISADTNLTFGQRKLQPHALTKLVKVSDDLLGGSVLNIDSMLMEELRYIFGITEETAFLNGDGAQKPLGVFTANASGIPTSRDITSGTSADFRADDLINMVGSLKAQYQARSTWIVHRDFITRVRKLKDGMGGYLWQPSIVAGNPDTMLTRPYFMSEYAPNTYTTGLYVAVLGDFSKYWIADDMGMTVQRLVELFALTNQVGFKARKKTDAMPVLSEAFSRLKVL